MVGNSDRDYLLSHAQLVIVPSVTEGFGMLPFEATAFGTPVISTKGGGLQDICPSDALFLTLRDNQTDVDTIWSMLSDKKTAADQYDSWSRRSKDFDWDATAEKFVALFSRVLSEAGRVDSLWPHLGHYKRSRVWQRIKLRTVRIAISLLGDDTRRRRVASRIYGAMVGK
jgi:hypothetical protein